MISAFTCRTIGCIVRLYWKAKSLTWRCKFARWQLISYTVFTLSSQTNRCKQTMKTLISCSILWDLIRAYSVCHLLSTCKSLPLSGQIYQRTNWYFSYSSQKIGDDILCKLSSQETIFRKYQSIFSGKIRKVFQSFFLWNFYTPC